MFSHFFKVKVAILILISLLMSPSPARAQEEETTLLLQSALAMTVAVMATTTPLLAAKKIWSTRQIAGVAPESYANDAASNMFSTILVTAFSPKNYFAALGTLGPMLGDLLTLGVYYWKGKKAEPEEFVKVNIKLDADGGYSGKVVTPTKKYYFNKCGLEIKNYQGKKNICQRVASCISGFCSSIGSWFLNSQGSKTPGTLHVPNNIILNYLESSLKREDSGISSIQELSRMSEAQNSEVVLVDAPDSAYQSEDTSVEELTYTRVNDLEIRIYDGKVEIIFPTHSATLKSPKIVVEPFSNG